MAHYAIKVHIEDKGAKAWVFESQKTMYGGKKIAQGDVLYVFDSENEGGDGLLARATVTSSKPVPRVSGIARQTPRVDVSAKRTARARASLGRADLKPHADWKDGKPETELNFKFYRQATNKIVGISDEVAVFLETFF